MKQNTNIFSCAGFISRKGFIANLFLIWSLHSLCYVSINCFQFEKIIPAALYALFFGVLAAFNVKKRLEDIKTVPCKNLFSFLFFLIYFLSSSLIFEYLQSQILAHIFTAFYICFILFLFKKGQFEIELPKTGKFNFCAFLYTWIWGLINKMPKTFYILLIYAIYAIFYIYLSKNGFFGTDYANIINEYGFDFKINDTIIYLLQGIIGGIFSLSAILFMIYCGIKSGDWLYEKSKTEHKLISKILTVIFVVTLLVFGFVSYSFPYYVWLDSICGYNSIKEKPLKYPLLKQNITQEEDFQRHEKMFKNMLETFYGVSKYEITENEYKIYVPSSAFNIKSSGKTLQLMNHSSVVLQLQTLLNIKNARISKYNGLQNKVGFYSLENNTPLLTVDVPDKFTTKQRPNIFDGFLVSRYIRFHR